MKINCKRRIYLQVSMFFLTGLNGVIVECLFSVSQILRIDFVHVYTQFFASREKSVAVETTEALVLSVDRLAWFSNF